MYIYITVPSIKISNGTKTFSSSEFYESQDFKNGEGQMHFYFGPQGQAVSADIKFHCTSASNFGVNKLFIAWINTLFIVDGTIRLTQIELDAPHKDKKKLWTPGFYVEFQFAKTVAEAEEQSTATLELVSNGPKPFKSLKALLTPKSNKAKDKPKDKAW